MYRFFNMNPFNAYEDDCTIRAISMAEGNTWDYTYDKLSDLAQSKRTMMNDRDFIIDYLDTYYRRIPTNKETVGELSYKYKNNVILITLYNHIVCSLMGTLYDTADCRDEQVEYAWLVK